MATVCIPINTVNPPYNSEDFKLYVPSLTNFLNSPDGQKLFDEYYKEANVIVKQSIFGAKWKRAMSYYIAHELTLYIQDDPCAENLSELENPNGGGIISKYSIAGKISATVENKYTTIQKDQAAYFNQTKWGQLYYALWMRTKIIPAFVVVK